MKSFEDELAAERTRRVRDLSDVRSLYITAPENLKVAAAHALVVLCYANWEGYFNFCSQLYVDCINSEGRRVVDISPSLLACSIDPHLESLKDRSFKVQHRPQFAKSVAALLGATVISGNLSILKSASNLDFDRLAVCLEAFNMPVDRFLKSANFIKYQLVKWRHQVAHGDVPDLSRADLVEHSHRAEDLLALLGEAFSDKLTQIARVPHPNMLA